MNLIGYETMEESFNAPTWKKTAFPDMLRKAVNQWYACQWCLLQSSVKYIGVTDGTFRSLPYRPISMISSQFLVILPNPVTTGAKWYTNTDSILSKM